MHIATCMRSCLSTAIEAGGSVGKRLCARQEAASPAQQCITSMPCQRVRSSPGRHMCTCTAQLNCSLSFSQARACKPNLSDAFRWLQVWVQGDDLSCTCAWPYPGRHDASTRRCNALSWHVQGHASATPRCGVIKRVLTLVLVFGLSHVAQGTSHHKHCQA